jgi:hypothetical protein
MVHNRPQILIQAQFPRWVKSVVLTVCQPLPVYPDQRTSTDLPGWSGSCQEETLARLFDQLVGAREQRRRHFDAERLGGRQIDNEIELGWLLDREVARLCAA